MNIEFKLPDWLNEINAEKAGTVYQSIEQKAEFVIELSRLNINNDTGGPFAAAIFDMKDNALICAGTNLVLSTNCSITHAEITAIILAQQKLRTYHLADCQLVSSCQPCAMCMGAIPWSGVTSLTCCASDADARAIGFNEGDKPDHWIEKYNARGIDVVIDVLRSKASQVLTEYAHKGGKIY